VAIVLVVALVAGLILLRRHARQRRAPGRRIRPER
jgi:hypothetical protein